MGLFVAGYDTRLYIAGSTLNGHATELEYDDYSTDDSGIMMTK